MTHKSNSSPSPTSALLPQCKPLKHCSCATTWFIKLHLLLAIHCSRPTALIDLPGLLQPARLDLHPFLLFVKQHSSFWQQARPVKCLNSSEDSSLTYQNSPDRLPPLYSLSLFHFLVLSLLWVMHQNPPFLTVLRLVSLHMPFFRRAVSPLQALPGVFLSYLNSLDLVWFNLLNVPAPQDIFSTRDVIVWTSHFRMAMDRATGFQSTQLERAP